ncbi:RHS repeat-associated core domain-containing protein [Paludibaculum fermentans]|uniref:RHS repeat-associated core domain-containing protein n=1 Tax=Paludibaculum fermentans TaxID=1473598 RepID=UPI003EBCF521
MWTTSVGATDYVYDAFDQLAAEFDPSTGLSGRQYITLDVLGAPKVAIDARGTLGVGQPHNHVPFRWSLLSGQNGRSAILGSGTDESLSAIPTLFTGKKRDAETGLDYFGARYFSGSQGRFTSPDPKLISNQRMLDPQQWNMYSYVRNNPLVAIDPNGKELHIVIVNRSNLPPATIAAAAVGVRGRYQEAGVQNVNVSFASEVPKSALGDKVNQHTVYLEYQTNHNGAVGIRSGADGNNPNQAWFASQGSGGGPGGSAAVVETTGPGVRQDANVEGEVNALSGVGVHEKGHKWLEHQGSSNADVMYGGNDQPTRTVPFTPSEAATLRKQLNTPEEQKAYEEKLKQKP